MSAYIKRWFYGPIGAAFRGKAVRDQDMQHCILPTMLLLSPQDLCFSLTNTWFLHIAHFMQPDGHLKVLIIFTTGMHPNMPETPVGKPLLQWYWVFFPRILHKTLDL